MPDATPALFGTGTFTGTDSVLALPRENVASLLDPRLELGPQDITPEGMHPVFFMLGAQSDVRGAWPVFRHLAVSYTEALVLIPNVRFRGGSRDFLHMPRLYLDSTYPTWLGQHVYGFNKLLRDVVASPERFTASDVVEGGRRLPLWDARITPVADQPEELVTLAYQRMAMIYDQPFLGLRAVWGLAEELACWMTFTNRKRTAVSVDLDIHDPFLTTCGFDRSYHLGAFAPGLVGTAVMLESDWTLTFPTDKFVR